MLSSNINGLNRNVFEDWFIRENKKVLVARDEYRVALMSSVVAALATYAELPKLPKEFEGLEDLEVFYKVYLEALAFNQLEPLAELQ